MSFAREAATRSLSPLSPGDKDVIAGSRVIEDVSDEIFFKAVVRLEWLALAAFVEMAGLILRLWHYTTLSEEILDQKRTYDIIRGRFIFCLSICLRRIDRRNGRCNQPLQEIRDVCVLQLDCALGIGIVGRTGRNQIS